MRGVRCDMFSERREILAIREIRAILEIRES